uniref:Uncharacterized protein n=1 Tax=Arundo donax TaxID=35708 RepID=A0A0A8ZW86_ARUDO
MWQHKTYILNLKLLFNNLPELKLFNNLLI